MKSEKTSGFLVFCWFDFPVIKFDKNTKTHKTGGMDMENKKYDYEFYYFEKMPRIHLWREKMPEVYIKALLRSDIEKGSEFSQNTTASE